MKKDYRKELIKEEIEAKREELNEIVLNSLDKNKVLKFSQELDLLINKYYSLSKG